MRVHHWKCIALALLIAAMVPITANKALADSKGSASSVWGANYFPNIPLITHEGKSVRFFDDLIKDKVVLINFIFTKCLDSCPLETARIRQVQQILGDRVGKDVFFYSISIDPTYDTPEMLKAYVDQYKIEPGWVFLTGKESDITLLRKRLGLYIEEIQGEDSTDHNLNLIIGNQSTGRWMKSSPFENPHILATQIGKWLHNWKQVPRTKNTYADAPELRNITKGESLFRTRCASCHTVGTPGAMASRKAIGPDLYGINQSRDRAWLVRWLAEPDKMLAEKDPLAMALYNQYNKLPMPNLRLNMAEIENLLGYIQELTLLAENKAKAHGRSDMGGHDNGDHHH